MINGGSRLMIKHWSVAINGGEGGGDRRGKRQRTVGNASVNGGEDIGDGGKSIGDGGIISEIQEERLMKIKGL